MLEKFNDKMRSDTPWDILENLRIGTRDPQERAPWPRSSDGLYSPSKKIVRQLNRRLKLESARDARQARQREKAREREREKTPFNRDQLNYSLRQKRKEKKNLRAARIFQASRKNAQEYYLFQRWQALFYKKEEFFSHLQSSSSLILQKQRQEDLIFQGNLQRERYYVSNLYEDYLLPLRGRNRVLVDPILHENHFKKAFLAQLHRRQHYYWHLFLQKQRCERRLHFLWSLLIWQVSHREKQMLTPTPLPRAARGLRSLLTSSRTLQLREIRKKEKSPDGELFS